MSEPVQPQLGAESFSCPHCGAFAHQTWYRAFLGNYGRDQKPSVFEYTPDLRNVAKTGKDEKDRTKQFLDRLEKNRLTYDVLDSEERLQAEMVNFCFCQCFSCKGFCVWVGDELVYPAMDSAIVAHAEM